MKKRLIDAYKLEELLRSNSGRYHHKDDVIAAIAGQPTVDAVEVVRCKDCRCNGACSIQDAMNWTPRTEIGEYFCSYGERREGE